MNLSPNPGDVVTFNVWRQLKKSTATQASVWNAESVDGVVVSKVIAQHHVNKVPIVMINVIQFGSGKLIDATGGVGNRALVFSVEEVRHP